MTVPEWTKIEGGVMRVDIEKLCEWLGRPNTEKDQREVIEIVKRSMKQIGFEKIPVVEVHR